MAEAEAVERDRGEAGPSQVLRTHRASHYTELWAKGLSPYAIYYSFILRQAANETIFT